MSSFYYYKPSPRRNLALVYAQSLLKREPEPLLESDPESEWESDPELQSESELDVEWDTEPDAEPALDSPAPKEYTVADLIDLQAAEYASIDVEISAAGFSVTLTPMDEVESKALDIEYVRSGSGVCVQVFGKTTFYEADYVATMIDDLMRAFRKPGFALHAFSVTATPCDNENWCTPEHHFYTQFRQAVSSMGPLRVESLYVCFNNARTIAAVEVAGFLEHFEPGTLANLTLDLSDESHVHNLAFLATTEQFKQCSIFMTETEVLPAVLRGLAFGSNLDIYVAGISAEVLIDFVWVFLRSEQNKCAQLGFYRQYDREHLMRTLRTADFLQIATNDPNAVIFTDRDLTSKVRVDFFDERIVVHKTRF